MKKINFEYTFDNGKRSIVSCIPQKIFYDDNLGQWIMKDADEQSFIMSQINRCFDESIPQYFMCATVFIKNDAQEFFMFFHNRLQKFVPPGGKIDNHETPSDAAIREVLEETSMVVELISASPVSEKPCPFGIDDHEIIPGVRYHTDLIYLGKVKDTSFKLDEREGHSGQWMSLDQIMAHPNILDDTKKWCHFFYTMRA
jgi:8-oxo-dGTP diphosphatase